MPTRPPVSARAKNKNMKLVSFCRRIRLVIQSGLSKTTISVNPGERIVLDDITAQVLPGDPQIESISDFGPYYQNFVQRPTKWRNKRVLFYRPRGIGDQLIASCLSRFFTEMLGAKCYQLADRVHEPIWLGNPYIDGAPISVPIGIDSLVRFKGRPFYDYAFFLESVSEWDSSAEQENVYDRLFAMIGFREVPNRFKSPIFQVSQADRNAYQDWIAKLSLATGIDFLARGYIFHQMRATNIGRTIPLKQQALVLNELDKLDIPILCTDDKALEPAAAEMVRQVKNAHDVSGQIDNIRLFGTMVANSRMTVSPDSLAIHFAAAAQIPALSLWGPFDPESRIKYYPRQIGLNHPERCANAFCHNYMPTLPTHLCPEGENQKYCACYDGVTAEEIRKAISALL